MLIDWVTAYLPMEQIGAENWQALRFLTERVLRFRPDSEKHGIDDCYFLIDRDAVVYETAAWESVRSDSHQIAFRVGSDALWIQGSPARVCGSGDAVFGEGASGNLDLIGCVRRMAAFVSQQIDVPIYLAPVKAWHVTRIDVTGNLILDDLAAVREALRILRNCEGGRYRVSQQSGDTVYWSHKSRLRSGKAYAKGPHIEYQTGKPDYTGRPYSETELQQINRLLRLELRLGAQWIRERAGCPWYELTTERLTEEWNDYFKRMIGDADMKTNDDVKERIMAVAATEGQGKAAHVCYMLIREHGWEKARNEFTKPTWYRHMKILHAAGLGDADIAAGNVVPLRRKILECQLVKSWADIHRIAA
jgi:II/X family phage/plasmid replication protein